MISYRVFPIDENGRLAGPPSILECHTDRAAMMAARDVVRHHPGAEVWDGARRVGSVRRNEASDAYMAEFASEGSDDAERAG